MNFEKFIQPKQVKIGDRDFTISMIPALDALPIHNAVAKAIADNGLLGITMLPVAVDRQILGYVAVSEGGVHIVPDTDRLFNDIFKGRISDAKELVIMMVKENFGFLITGDLLDKLVDRQEATDSVS